MTDQGAPAGKLTLILRGTLRWSLVWALLGLILGLVLTLTKAPPIAESGRKPDDLLFYAFWIPLVAALGAVFGFGLGFVFEGLRIATAWPRAVCGAIAGAVVGLVFGTTATSFVLLVAIGVISGLVSGLVGRWRPTAATPS